jgi:hypothetical protein
VEALQEVLHSWHGVSMLQCLVVECATVRAHPQLPVLLALKQHKRSPRAKGGPDSSLVCQLSQPGVDLAKSVRCSGLGLCIRFKRNAVFEDPTVLEVADWGQTAG